MSVAELGARPSPAPTAALHSSSSGRAPVPAARGTAAVAADQRATPRGRITAPPLLAAWYPPGTCVRAYPAKNADCTRPLVVGDQPKSWAMGMMATDMLT